MASVPIAVGMSLCDYVIIKGKTGKPSLIGCFTTLRSSLFPVVVPLFSVFSTLADGMGDVTMDLMVSRLTNGEEIYTHRGIIHFLDKLQEVYYHVRLGNLSFLTPGVYQFTLLGNREWIAHRKLQVKQIEEE